MLIPIKGVAFRQHLVAVLFYFYFYFFYFALNKQFVDFLQDNTHMFSNKVFSRPGQRQGLIYKHLCNSLSNSLSDPL